MLPYSASLSSYTIHRNSTVKPQFIFIRGPEKGQWVGKTTDLIQSDGCITGPQKLNE
jgi:hypothetical protein